MKLRAVGRECCHAAFTETGEMEFFATQDEAIAHARKLAGPPGADEKIVYVARLLLTNDEAQWR